MFLKLRLSGEGHLEEWPFSLYITVSAPGAEYGVWTGGRALGTGPWLSGASVLKSVWSMDSRASRRPHSMDSMALVKGDMSPRGPWGSLGGQLVC